LVVRYGAKDLCHEPPDTGGCGGAATLPLQGPDRGSHQSLQRSTELNRLSSALGAGAAASHRLLPGRFLCARAGTP
jgi:hypothetical protein